MLQSIPVNWKVMGPQDKIQSLSTDAFVTQGLDERGERTRINLKGTKPYCLLWTEQADGTYKFQEKLDFDVFDQP